MLDGYKKRVEKYNLLRDLTVHRAKLSFQQLLSRRGYDGKLKINFEAQTLTITVRIPSSPWWVGLCIPSLLYPHKVQVDSTEKASATKNTLSLSGGERSFTTVCFIMSLWDAMEAPFRILDEFDVFMVCRSALSNNYRPVSRHTPPHVLFTLQDMLNRKIAMTSMLLYAEEQSQRQFIFLTPQDMQ